MRKDNEQLVASYQVAVYADTDKLNDPSGSGSNPAEFSAELTSSLTDGITEHITEQLSENFSDWNDDLRCEVTPIS